jgi:membrane-associated HD superfamily phosphohydrolase
VESFEQLEATIERIVREALEDGQFDECPLTLLDLTLIKTSLKETMRSMLHARPGNYPTAQSLK